METSDELQVLATVSIREGLRHCMSPQTLLDTVEFMKIDDRQWELYLDSSVV
jgi:hypothetical protein